jgi:hypothetical protein
MLEIDPVGRVGLTVDAAEDRATVLALPTPAGFAEPAILGLDGVGGFFMASETDARGRLGAGVTIGLLAEPMEPVGESRTVASSEGFILGDAESDCLARPGALTFAGMTDILRVDEFVAFVGLDGVDDAKAGLEVTAGGEVVDFFKAGALDLIASPEVGLDPVGFVMPETGVAEANACLANVRKSRKKSEM